MDENTNLNGNGKSNSNGNNGGKKRSVWQFIKFAIVGVLNTLVDFLVFTALTLIFGVSKDDALLMGLFTLIAYACGVLNSFLLNSRWTFREEYRKSTKEKLLFIIVNLVSWGVSFGLTYVFANHVFAGSGIALSIARLLHYQDIDNLVSILAKLLAAPIVIIVNFIGSKLFVFNGNGKQ